MDSTDYSRLSMPVGEAMFTQRSIRRFRPDPIPVEDLRLMIEAAVRAPNGYPRGDFGPNVRRPTTETTHLNHWGEAVPWTSR